MGKNMLLRCTKYTVLSVRSVRSPEFNQQAACVDS